jgi:tetratricopeptide (TPR) repeat protein
MAMNVLGHGLTAAEHHEDALNVREAELSMRRRLGESEHNMLVAQTNIANTSRCLGRLDKASRMQRDVYSGRLKLNGEEHLETLRAAYNYANSLFDLRRFQEAKSLLRKAVPVARRVLGESHEITLQMRWLYAVALYRDPGATLDDLREAVATLEDAGRIAQRVFGGAHPIAAAIEESLRNSRAIPDA